MIASCISTPYEISVEYVPDTRFAWIMQKMPFHHLPQYADAKAHRQSSDLPQRLRHIGLCLVVALLAGGCGQSLSKVTKHGHQFRATDAQLIQPGMSQEDVRLSLGTPTTTSRHNNGQVFYYISSTTSQMAFLEPKEIDRRVFAVYFNELGSVDRIANYGLKDGRVFDFVSRTTPAANNSETGLLGQMFKNLGKRGAFGG